MKQVFSINQGLCIFFPDLMSWVQPVKTSYGLMTHTVQACLKLNTKLTIIANIGSSSGGWWATYPQLFSSCQLYFARFFDHCLSISRQPSLDSTLLVQCNFWHVCTVVTTSIVPVLSYVYTIIITRQKLQVLPKL